MGEEMIMTEGDREIKMGEKEVEGIRRGEVEIEKMREMEIER